MTFDIERAYKPGELALIIMESTDVPGDLFAFKERCIKEHREGFTVYLHGINGSDFEQDVFWDTVFGSIHITVFAPDFVTLYMRVPDHFAAFLETIVVAKS